MINDFDSHLQTLLAVQMSGSFSSSYLQVTELRKTACHHFAAYKLSET